MLVANRSSILLAPQRESDGARVAARSPGFMRAAGLAPRARANQVSARMESVFQLGYSSARVCTVFLSSGDDARYLRDFVEDLVNEAVNPALQAANAQVVVQVTRWERSSPGRTAEGENTNARFVRMAKASNVTICLLIERLGEGTREELEAVLDDRSIELSVFWFVDLGPWLAGPVGDFLKAHQPELYVDRAGPPDSPAASIAIVRLILELVLKTMLAHEEAGLRERR